MARWASLLFTLGLLLGPGYYLYASYLSGEAGPTFVMTERASRWTLPDGTILRFPRSQAYRPVEIELAPEMNPIGIELVFEAAATATGKPTGADSYLATLVQGDQPAFSRQIDISLQAGSQEKVRLGSLEIYLPAKYTFTLEGPATPGTSVSQVTLQLRHKVKPLLMPLVWMGVVFLAAGLALLLEKRLRGPR